MSGRLIVLSNRIPAEGPPSGGLVVALHEALSEHGGIWLGAHPDLKDEVEDGLIDISSGDYDLKAYRLSQEDHDGFYLGFSNSVLWPVFHGRTDLMRIESGFAEAYRRVNRRIARMLARIVEPDDTIWIHDYHFLPMAKFLRDEGVTARIGMFLHIPFPEPSHAEAIPDREVLAHWLAAHDVIGVQTRQDVRRCLEFFRGNDDAMLLPGDRVQVEGKVAEVRAFPIGIDTDGFRAAAVEHADDVPRHLKMAGSLVIGVDRLDYTKGLANRFKAFGTFLERRAPDSPRATLLQIAPPSREDIEAYRETTEELETLAGRINGAHASLDYTPVRFMHSSFPRDTLAPLYRFARVGLVTPFADGMNLVAKEFVAAQDDDDPGVLVLSRMAGAAEDLDAALLVNPYDISETASAIAAALEMSLDERRDRQARLLKATRATDITLWSDAFLSALRGSGDDQDSAPENLYHLRWPA